MPLPSEAGRLRKSSGPKTLRFTEASLPLREVSP